MKTMIIIAIILAVIVLLNRKHIINRLLIIALLVIISQRPMLKNQNEKTYSLNLDVLFVVDNTVSMNAIDGNETRLEAVKNDCKNIIKSMPGANFALVTYANTAIVKYPYTSDIALITDVIDQMKIIDPLYAKGSTLDMPYDSMKILLTSSNKKDKHQSIVFFMGDGELIGKEKTDTNLSKYKDITKLIDNGAVLGYGTNEGAKVKITESTAIKNEKLVDKNGYLVDGNTNSSAISKMNETNLKALASNLSLDYYHMPNDSKLNEKIVKIKEDSVVDDDSETELDKDIYYYFSGALIVLLLLELYHYRRDER